MILNSVSIKLQSSEPQKNLCFLQETMIYIVDVTYKVSFWSPKIRKRKEERGKRGKRKGKRKGKGTSTYSLRVFMTVSWLSICFLTLFYFTDRTSPLWGMLQELGIWLSMFNGCTKLYLKLYFPAMCHTSCIKQKGATTKETTAAPSVPHLPSVYLSAGRMQTLKHLQILRVSYQQFSDANHTKNV